MKTGKKDIKESAKNPTTNYLPDKHKVFCARCIAFNGKCPNTGKNWPDPTCNL